jgi:hypothetical protein
MIREGEVPKSLMSRKFGNTLFGNRKGLAADHSDDSAGESAPTLGELSEQVIILSREDIRADVPPAPVLDWSTFERPEIALQLKDTEGLAEGSVTIKASTLQRIHPALLPVQLAAEYQFPISLKTVVLQVQAHLRRSSEERQNPAVPDFDTPIAQVAREDEGFFNLAKIAEPKETPIHETARANRNIPGPILTPADRPGSPMLRKKSPAESIDSGPLSRSRAMTAVPPQSACSETEVGRAKHAGPKSGAIAVNSLKRIGLERLREIFMTEEQLDAHQVANLLAAFPKVNSAMIMLGDGTVLGGNLPEGYHLETARLAPVIMRSVREFDRGLRPNETSAFTLLGDQPVSLFAEGNIYILISHQGRGLLPGVRERIGDVAQALDALCCGVEANEGA